MSAGPRRRDSDVGCWRANEEATRGLVASLHFGGNVLVALEFRVEDEGVGDVEDVGEDEVVPVDTVEGCG